MHATWRVPTPPPRPYPIRASFGWTWKVVLSSPYWQTKAISSCPLMQQAYKPSSNVAQRLTPDLGQRLPSALEIPGQHCAEEGKALGGCPPELALSLDSALSQPGDLEQEAQLRLCLHMSNG